MAIIQHSAVSGSELHGITAFTVASGAARDFLTVTSGDLGKVALVTADNTFYVLTGVSPTVWSPIAGPLATVATSGSYNDLANTPTIPAVSTAGASGSYTDLINKPSLATVATTGAYSDLTGRPAQINLATNLVGGSAGRIAYQVGVDATGFLGIGTSGQVLTSTGGVPSWQAVPTFTGGTVTSLTTNTITMGGIGASPLYGTIQGAGGTGFGNNAAGIILKGGSSDGYGGSIVLQPGVSNIYSELAGTIILRSSGGTDRLVVTYTGAWTVGGSDGTAGQVLTSAGSGSTPTWQDASTVATSATTATNLAGGGVGYVPYQSASGTTLFVNAGTSGYVLTSAGSGAAPTWAAPASGPAAAGSLTGTTLASTVVTSSLTSVGTLANLTVTNTITGSVSGSAATATTATNIAGGAAGSVPYQTSSGTTTLLAKGTDGQVLTLASGVPTWAAASGGGGGASLSTSNNWTAGQRSAVVALTAGATVAIDLALANNFSLTPNQNFTLNFPTNVGVGQSGIIAITQSSGGAVLSLASGYVKAGGTTPVLSTAAGAVDYLSYYVETTGRIFVSLTSDVK